MPNQGNDPVMYLAGDPRTACSSALAEEHHVGLKERPPPVAEREGRKEGGQEGRQEGIWNKATIERARVRLTE